MGSGSELPLRKRHSYLILAANPFPVDKTNKKEHLSLFNSWRSNFGLMFSDTFVQVPVLATYLYSSLFKI